jgi:hypothetical protein
VFIVKYLALFILGRFCMRYIRVISGFSLALLLSSCSAYDFAREKYTGERAQESVPGPRRVPIKNPTAAKSSAPKVQPVVDAPIVPTGSAAAPAPAKTQATAKDSPYDQYDEKGNEVGGTNYLAKWFGDSSTEGAAQDTRVSGSSSRKSFKGNVAQTSVAAAPISSAPISVEPVAAPVELKKSSEEKITPKASMQVPVAPAPAAIEEFEQPKIVPAPRNGKGNGVIIPITDLAPSAGGMEIAANDAPALRTVPQKPAQFEIIKKEKDAQLQQLQQDHQNADEEKTLLNAEPSDLKLPDVEDTLEEIKSALESPEPLIASNSYIQEASPSSGQ